MIFSVSVIIPVYNAEQFITKAITTVLMSTEVQEVIVVNDGSTDGSLKKIEKLQETDNRIFIYHHPQKNNKGRSASRNLGIMKATSNYIAFLDADDFYTDNRFEKDKEVLQDHQVDGCYNAVGFLFYRETEESEQRHFKIATLAKEVPPKDLFKNIVTSKLGYLHLNGLTVKRTVFDKTGLFNEKLVVAEDSDLIFKIALKCTLVAGEISSVVAKRGVHDTNIFTQDGMYKDYNIYLYESLISWSLKNDISEEEIDRLFDALWRIKFRQEASLLSYIAYWIRLQVKWPRLLITTLAIKYFPIVRLRQRLFPSIYK